jgi:Uma2 family endonuclease
LGFKWSALRGIMEGDRRADLTGEKPMTALPPRPKRVHYPDDDGLPMSDNTAQYRWMSILKWSADGQYHNDPAVFVAGNHLIYPVEGDAKTRQAPDAYVAFGRPKDDRGSYKVWEEAGIFPQVVFEVWSPSNRVSDMEDKREFYEKYGAEEYYIVYPEFPSHADGWRREGAKLVRIPEMNDFVSPRLGWRFHLVGGELTVFGPDGRELRDPVDVIVERDAAAAERDAAAAERDAAAAERDAARERAEKLAEKLRQLGVDPDAP